MASGAGLGLAECQDDLILGESACAHRQVLPVRWDIRWDPSDCQNGGTGGPSIGEPGPRHTERT
jgi:hypothetical protein